MGEMKLRPMQSLENQLVQSPATEMLSVSLLTWGQDATAFVREVKARTIIVVDKYSTKTELSNSWDIRCSNVRLNQVFELNGLPYGPYLEEASEDANDTAKGKKQCRDKGVAADEGTLKGKVAAPLLLKKKKAKVGLASGTGGEMGGTTQEAKASASFVRNLDKKCTESWEVMPSTVLQEASARMLKMTRVSGIRTTPFSGLLVKTTSHLGCLGALGCSLTGIILMLL